MDLPKYHMNLRVYSILIVMAATIMISGVIIVEILRSWNIPFPRDIFMVQTFFGLGLIFLVGLYMEITLVTPWATAYWKVDDEGGVTKAKPGLYWRIHNKDIAFVPHDRDDCIFFHFSNRETQLLCWRIRFENEVVTAEDAEAYLRWYKTLINANFDYAKSWLGWVDSKHPFTITLKE